MKNPKSLAIDWIGERIYVMDAAEQKIISTDLNGSEQVTIATTGAMPLDLVVDPNSGMMFWSTLGKGIISASMDGTNKRVIVERGIEWATGLAIDYPSNRIYWADSRKGTIETVLFTGKSRHVITQFKNRSMQLNISNRTNPILLIRNNQFTFFIAMLPKRLQVFEDSIYIALYDQTIYKINKFGIDKGEVLVENFQRASDIFILHPLKQNLNSKMKHSIITI